MIPGQELVCTNREGWSALETGEDIRGPKFNEIVTFSGRSPYDPEFIALAEYATIDYNGQPDYWDQRWFSPVLDADDISAMLGIKELEICEVSG